MKQSDDGEETGNIWIFFSLPPENRNIIETDRIITVLLLSFLLSLSICKNSFCLGNAYVYEKVGSTYHFCLDSDNTFQIIYVNTLAKTFDSKLDLLS